MSELSICFVASEVAPFAKTGGLADVAGALPVVLADRGHDVRLFTPLYAQSRAAGHEFVPVDFLQQIPITLGDHSVRYSIFTSKLAGSNADIYLVDCPQLFHRESIYTGERDDHLRFALLQRATLECCQRMAWSPQILHCNDWHTALLPLLLKTVYSWDRVFQSTRTLLTIHNLAYQGVFPADVIANLGLFDHRDLLFQLDLEQGAISFLKSGILYADVVSTVSRTYAREIQGDELGMGLAELLRERTRSVVGIVNGVDYQTWDPATDPYIPHHYTAETVDTGKTDNQHHLLTELGLSHEPGVPTLGIVSRLTNQKGFELVFDPLAEALRHLDIRLVVLGSGEEHLENQFAELQARFPAKVCFYRGYNEQLAHLIEAGADIFLMPSRFEPCGLNQMYSLRYGTVPIVRKTGGLADTVQLFDPETREGTGFVFDHYDSTGFAWALKTALLTYRDTAAWQQLRLNGMAMDYSWQRQGAKYEQLYRQMVG